MTAFVTHCDNCGWLQRRRLIGGQRWCRPCLREFYEWIMSDDEEGGDEATNG
jgi:hypothetical protein